MIGRQAGADGLTKTGQGIALAAPQLLVAHPAAGLNHAGGRQIVQMHQQVRGEAVEIAGFVRQVGQHPGQAQGLGADLDHIAGLQVQGHEQPGLGPGFTGLRAGAGFFSLIKGCGTFQGAA